TTLNAYSENSSTYKGIFRGEGTTCVGYVRYSNGYSDSRYSYGYNQYSSSGVTNAMLGWNSSSFNYRYPYTSSNPNNFYDYKVGSNTSSSSSSYYYNYVQPSGTTWQYSCNDYRPNSSDSACTL